MQPMMTDVAPTQLRWVYRVASSLPRNDFVVSTVETLPNDSSHHYTTFQVVAPDFLQARRLVAAELQGSDCLNFRITSLREVQTTYNGVSFAEKVNV